MRNYPLICGAMIALTACQPPTKSTKSADVSAVSAPASTTGHTDIHTQHPTMQGMNPSTDTQPAHVNEYMQAMTTMHTQMMSASNMANPDVAFATGMTAHHDGAIAMAKIQLKYGKDSQMRALAQNIINNQQAEIQQMQTWLTHHNTDKTANAINGNTNMPAMDIKNHEAVMQGIMATDPDIAFAKGMISHHQGAIDMANTEIKMGKDKAMLNLANRIQRAQDPEIKQMQAWLESRKAK